MARNQAGTVLSVSYTLADPPLREYPFSIPFEAVADISVTLNGLAVSSDLYVVEPNIAQTGGNVRFLAVGEVTTPQALAAGDTLLIERDTEVARAVAYGRTGYAQSLAVEVQAALTQRILEELAARLVEHADIHVSNADLLRIIMGISVSNIADGVVGMDQLTSVVRTAINDKVLSGSLRIDSGTRIMSWIDGAGTGGSANVPPATEQEVFDHMKNIVVDGDGIDTTDVDVSRRITVAARTATTGQRGIVELATTAEMSAGTANKVPDAAKVKKYVDDNAGGALTDRVADNEDAIEDLETFEGALRSSTTEQATTAVVVNQLNRSYRLGSLTIAPSDIKTGDEYTVQVASGGEETTSHTFKATDLAAKSVITQQSNLNDVNSISWQHLGNDITYRIAQTAAGGWYFEAEGAGAAGGGTYQISVVRHRIDATNFVDSAAEAGAASELSVLAAVPGIADYSVGDIINVLGVLRVLVAPTDEGNMLRGEAAQSGANRALILGASWSDPTYDGYADWSLEGDTNPGRNEIRIAIPKSRTTTVEANTPATLYVRLKDLTSGFQEEASLTRNNFRSDSWGWSTPASGSTGSFADALPGHRIELSFYTDVTFSTPFVVHNVNRWELWGDKFVEPPAEPSSGTGGGGFIQRGPVGAITPMATTGRTAGNWSVGGDEWDIGVRGKELRRTVALTAAQAGNVLIFGEVHAEVAAGALGGGERFVTEARVVRLRSGAYSLVVDHMDYGPRNVNGTSHFFTATRKADEGLTAPDEGIAGDIYILEVRVVSQSTVREMTFSAARNTIILAGLGGSAAAASRTLTTRGRLVARSGTIATALKARAANFTRAELPWTIPAGVTGYAIPDQAQGAGGQFFVPPGSTPSGAVDGLWFVSKVDDVEKNAVWLAWGGTPYTDESQSGHDVGFATLMLRGGLAGGSPLNRVLVRWTLSDTGFFSVNILGDATGVPANSIIEIYEHGLFEAA